MHEVPAGSAEGWEVGMGRCKHPLAGKTVKLNINGNDIDNLNGKAFVIEDYWENISGKSWMFCDGYPACLNYAM